MNHSKSRFQIQIMALSILAIFLSAMITGCTKPRDATLPDSVDAETFQISDLQGPVFQMKTGLQLTSWNEPTSKLAAANEKPKAMVAETNVPTRLTGVFKDRPVNAKLGTQYPLIMKISDRKYVTVSKIVNDTSELSLLEKQIAKQDSKGLIVPMFKIPIKRIGVLSRVKNDLKEDTGQFEFKDTEVESATHVQVDLLGSNTLDIGKDPSNKKDLEQIFIEDRLAQKVSTYEQLTTDLQLQTKENLTGKVYTLIDSNSDSAGGTLFIYKIIKVSEIKDTDLLLKLKNGLGTNEISTCGDSILQQLEAADRQDCVILLSHKVPVSFIQARIAIRDRNDVESPDIELEDSGKRTGLIKITKRTLLTPISIGVQQQLNPLNTIRVIDIKDKEFLFRRTFEDGASTITAFGPGASGSLELVRFDLEKARLVVRRVLTLNGDKLSSTIDKEELLSIPVKYLKRISKSDIVASVSETTLDQAEYISLDWTQNSIPVSNSPLSFFADGSCFQSTSNQTITDMDMRLTQGMLNFSISGSYTFRPECMSFYGMNDYWYDGGLQSNYNLKERISFKFNSGENDKPTNLEIPFRAQNLLGFGIFTMDQRAPDAFGNIGSPQSERALPVIQNFENGRKLTYVLGGLPASGEIRDTLIKSTQQVIADWNEALKKAFKGTNLSRDGAYVDLQVDGVDIPEGKLGDLDRNYIWNFEKNLDSGLLGMSQAGPNPRSGKIEQNNVLMYSGNLMSYIGAQKEIARIQREYREMKDKILKTGTENSSTAPIQQVDRSSPVQKSSQNSSQNLMSLILPLSGSEIFTRIRGELMTQGRSSDEFESKKRSILQTIGEKSYIQKIFQRAMEMQVQGDENALNALSASEVLKAYGNRLSRDERLALSLQSRRLALISEFEKNFRKGPGCALAPRFTNAGDLEKTPTIEIFAKWYTSTLAHEIGHSLGLTHNFQGSFDKANMKFANETSDRNYSSIMDYIPDTHLKYGGPGPYDVHALRAIYTGLIALKDGKEISLSDYKKQTLGDSSWWQMNASHVQKLPVKFYNYCTDIHVGGDPTCNRWDMGTSGEEVAAWYADEYRNLYPVLNAVGNRINIRGTDRYVSRIFYEFFALRPFMDETFLRAISGSPDWESFAKGAIEALKVFTEVIATPDTTANFSDASRFEIYASKSGPVLVEKRPSKDVMIPGYADRVDTRGIELEKAIATMLLTSRGTGHPRYEAASLRVSFAEFEKYILGTEKPEEMVSLGLLRQMIEDNLGGLTLTDKGFASLPGNFKPEVTEIMRYYAILGSTLYLSADTIEDKYDFSSIFRVGSSTTTPPQDRVMLTKLDQDLKSKTSLKLWAFDNATAASSIVRSAEAKRIHIENAKVTVTILKSLLEADKSNKSEAIKKAKSDLVAQLIKMNTNSALLNKDESSKGDSFPAKVDLALEVMKSQINLIGKIVEAGKSGLDISKVVKDRRNMIENLAKSDPLVGIAEKALIGIYKEKSPEGQVLSEINSDQDLENNYGLVVSNLQTINRFVEILNPELNR